MLIYSTLYTCVFWIDTCCTEHSYVFPVQKDIPHRKTKNLSDKIQLHFITILFCESVKAKAFLNLTFFYNNFAWKLETSNFPFSPYSAPRLKTQYVKIYPRNLFPIFQRHTWCRELTSDLRLCGRRGSLSLSLCISQMETVRKRWARAIRRSNPIIPDD